MTSTHLPPHLQNGLWCTYLDKYEKLIHGAHTKIFNASIFAKPLHCIAHGDGVSGFGAIENSASLRMPDDSDIETAPNKKQTN